MLGISLKVPRAVELHMGLVCVICTGPLQPLARATFVGVLWGPRFLLGCCVSFPYLLPLLQ